MKCVVRTYENQERVARVLGVEKLSGEYPMLKELKAKISAIPEAAEG